ncbi:hypothetical protein KM1_239090 [Entamoeba histolytica HM-3:IMSS]|uniref:Single tm domain protein n=2 Tax=Entamoeba histolytica TaxID=5759 RepID=A0A175JEU2_ENTHI|nr:hypothetical protein KM1_239090 [Entamoeba histolytica HM-3:IMSS]GAT92171.1 single tm domain protein [Entamoeba histolytica]
MTEGLKTIGAHISEDPELILGKTAWVIIGYIAIGIALIGGIAFGLLTYRKKRNAASYSNI